MGIPKVTEMKCTSCGYEFTIKGDRAYFPCPQCDGEAYWKDSARHKGQSFSGKEKWNRHDWD